VIDAHCHLDFEAFDADRADVIDRAAAAGVTRFVVAGYDPAGWERQRALEAADTRVFCAYGLHPRAVALTDRQGVSDALWNLADLGPPAIGELGLDRSRHCPADTFDLQLEAFREQLALAVERNLPIVLHVVKCHGAVLDVLNSDGVPEAGGMVHAFSGSPELVGEYERKGLHLSFSAAVTWPSRRRARAAAASVSRDRLLVESDAPDQPAMGAAAQRNEPSSLIETVRCVAELRGCPPAEIAELTANNARALFRLK